jgi:hypothetical protein
MWDLGLCQCDHNNQLITLSVITLSGFQRAIKVINLELYSDPISIVKIFDTI